MEKHKQMRNTEQRITNALLKLSREDRALFERLTQALDKVAANDSTSGSSTSTKAKASIERLKLAKASNYRTTTVTGSMAVAQVKNIHPLQRTVEMVLTPLNTPNANKQAIPDSEANNILHYAPYMPIRVFFDGDEVLGHAGAKDCGVINEVWRDNDNIMARGIIWAESNPTFITYLDDKGSVGTSWEIYYEDSKRINGVEFLYGTIFAATAIVGNPAYGDKTRAVVK